MWEHFQSHDFELTSALRSPHPTLDGEQGRPTGLRPGDILRATGAPRAAALPPRSSGVGAQSRVDGKSYPTGGFPAGESVRAEPRGGAEAGRSPA